MVAFTAWIALNPYFFWGSSTALLAASLATAACGVALFVRGNRPRLDAEWIGVAILSLFLIYATALPRVDGGHTRWIFVLPTLWTLALAKPSERSQMLDAFAWIFALSLIPGIAVAILCALGAPIALGTGPLNPGTGQPMIGIAGALFLERNSLALPWGGVLFRVCAIYDEPGTVGTVAALLLAAYSYDVRKWRTLVLYVAGVLSFSLAFLGLTLVGLACSMRARHLRVLAIILAIPLVAATLMVTGKWRPGAPVGTVTSITIDEAAGNRPFIVKEDVGGELRQLEALDNRMTPTMAALTERYLASPPRILLLGIASDASVVLGGISQSWRRLFTDFGVIGVVLFAAGIGSLAWAGWRSASYNLQAAVFLLLFCASVYQRPIVWMPYGLLMLLCAPRVSAPGRV